MSEARRSVPDSEIMKYEAFNQSLKASRGATAFSFNESEAAGDSTGAAPAFGGDEDDQLYEA